LKPTGTFLDDTHILSISNYTKLIFPENLLILETPTEQMKYFYLYDENNFPILLRMPTNPKKENMALDEKKYLSAYIGYDEAVMMKQEKLFSKEGDTIDNLF
jgi:hypothetical protein